MIQLKLRKSTVQRVIPWGVFIGSLWGVHVYARDFGKNEVALARYLRGVGFKALQRTQKIL